MIVSESKNKHMKLEDRIEIQECLNKGMTFKAIGKRIGKDPTTVSKEVKLHSKAYSNRFTSTDDCCPKLIKAPFVCNNCLKKNTASCKYIQRRYEAKSAQAEYESVLKESREGIPLNKEEFYETEKVISAAVKSGQHIYHAIHSNDVNVSKSTVYRHIKMGYYSISPIDLPRAVKFKSRKQKHDYVPKGLKIGRMYDDFTTFIADNPLVPYVEMDTVVGRPGGKLIMTFQFVNVDFMFGILLDNKTAAEAGNKITELKLKLSSHGIQFGSIFPVLLTDNGGEFADVFAFENDLEGQKETLLYFCDPNCSYQKPHVENNHTMFRDIVPSGSSFENFTQETVNLIFSHVNAVKRKQFNGKSAYDMFSFTYSPFLASLLGIEFVNPTDVVQSPSIIKTILK